MGSMRIHAGENTVKFTHLEGIPMEKVSGILDTQQNQVIVSAFKAPQSHNDSLQEYYWMTVNL